MRVVMILFIILLTCCKASFVNNNQLSTFNIEFQTSQACDRGYTLVNGGKFYNHKGSILKDTCNIPFADYLQNAKSSYIPSIKDILRFENALMSQDLRKYYRLYSGFINYRKDTILEAVLLQPSIIKSIGKAWKSERYQVKSSPPFPKRRKNKIEKSVFYFSLNKGDLVEGDEILKYKFDN